MEQLNDLIEEEDEKQNKNIVKIYKETKLVDASDATKGKSKMVNFKKNNEL